MHVNKVHSVFPIGRFAKDLGKDEDWLWDVVNGDLPLSISSRWS
ncbi:RNAse (barnase) inhibitor barstar [Bradyrhizobium sp. USDA 4518]